MMMTEIQTELDATAVIVPYQATRVTGRQRSHHLSCGVTLTATSSYTKLNDCGA